MTEKDASISTSQSDSPTPPPKLTAEELEAQKLFQKQYASAASKMASSYQKVSSTTFLSKFDREKVGMYLQNPARYEKQLRQLSNYFYNISPEYKRIIWYIALMPTYAYILEPTSLHESKIDPVKSQKAFFKQAAMIEKMNIRHEMQNAMKIALREDTFFGYEYESKDSYFIRRMDADYCRISHKYEGVWMYQFDFSYYDGNREFLENEPEEFQVKYQQYKNTKEKWITLDIDKTVCFKVNEDIDGYSMPPFSGMFEAIFDVDDYKKLKKNKAEIDNFLILTQRIPMDEKNPELNKFLIDPAIARIYNDGLAAGVPSGIGIITSPMQIEAIRLEQSKTHADTVSEAQRELYTSAGVSQFIFNSDKNSSIGLNKSIVSDEQIAFSMLRQIERWLNRKLSKVSGQHKHQVKFLDITVFNEGEVQKTLKEAAQSSMPTKFAYAASLGMSPLDFYNAALLENVVLDINSILVPLQSSHTQSDKGDSGAPKKTDGEISDSGQTNRDANTDENKKS